jgi:hypothetical protein
MFVFDPVAFVGGRVSVFFRKGRQLAEFVSCMTDKAGCFHAYTPARF